MTRTPYAHAAILIAFLANIFGPSPFAQAVEFRLPAPGVMVHLSPEFNPPILKGIKVHPDHPFRFDFILDEGDSAVIPAKAEIQKQEASKLIKYFLASLTIPEKDLWVNLSPYENKRIIPQSFGLTEMGRDLLAEDYMLKQITASLIYPEDTIGKKFWKRIYEEASKKFGTTNVVVNTFNKVWIVPDKAVVFENAKAGAAYVVASKLKVMLEEDYLALSKHQEPTSAARSSFHSIGANIIREIVIPELTKEVNEDKNFAQLRQVYNSLILATWYKKKIKDSILAQVYSDKNKTFGIRYHSSRNDVEFIYQRYLRAFKKGVYNYIKEDVDPASQEVIPRKYFSGGVDWAMIGDEQTDLGLNGAGIEITDDLRKVPKGLPDSEIIVQADADPAIDEANAKMKNDRTIPVNEYINKPSMENYAKLSDADKHLLNERLKNVFISSKTSSSPYASFEAWGQDVIRAAVNMEHYFERYPDAQFIVLGASPEWVVRTMEARSILSAAGEMNEKRFNEKFKYVALSKSEDKKNAYEDLDTDQIKAYRKYLESLGLDPRSIAARKGPTFIVDYTFTGESIKLLIDIEEHWAKEYPQGNALIEELRGISGKKSGKLGVSFIHAYDFFNLEYYEKNKIPPLVLNRAIPQEYLAEPSFWGLANVQILPESLIRSIANTDKYFESRWIPSFPRSQWVDHPQGPAIIASPQAALTYFGLIELLFKDNEDFRKKINGDSAMVVVPDFIKIIGKVDQKFGKGSVVIYGGLVRDYLLGKERSSGDIDILVRSINPQLRQEDFDRADEILKEIIRQLGVTRDGYTPTPQDLVNGSVMMGKFTIDYIGLYHARSVFPKQGLEKFIGGIQESINTMWMDSDGQVVDPYGMGRQDLEDHVLRFVGSSDVSIQKFANQQTILRAIRYQHELGFRLESKTKEIIDHFFTDEQRFPERARLNTWLQAVHWYKQYQQAKAEAEKSRDYTAVYGLMDDLIRRAPRAFHTEANDPYSGFRGVEQDALAAMEKARTQEDHTLAVVFFERFMDYANRWPKGMEAKVDLMKRKSYSPKNDPLVIGANIRDIFKYAQDPLQAAADLKRIGFSPFLESSGINLDKILAQRARLDLLERLSPQQQVDQLLDLKERKLILASVQAMHGQLQAAAGTIRSKGPAIITAQAAQAYLNERVHWGKVLFVKDSKRLNEALNWVAEQFFKRYLGESVSDVMSGLDNSSEKLWALEGLAAEADSAQLTKDLAMKAEKPGSTRRGFLGMGVKAVVIGAVAARFPGIALGQSNEVIHKQYLGFFTTQAAGYNPNTGFTISNVGDPNQYAAAYDSSLRIGADILGDDAGKMLDTYAQNNTITTGANSPETMNITYNPVNGAYQYVPTDVSAPQWWQNFNWSVDGGVNAWIGNAALKRYAITKEPRYLAFAQQRADFLMNLLDLVNGGLRYGPQGQSSPNTDPSFYWNLKSTENNESALYFFDNLFEVTKDTRYRDIADNIYNWLMHTMYDPVNNAFSRGATLNTQTGLWVNDGPDLFATDTTSWAPLERMLNDQGFGATRLERLQKYENMIAKAEQTTGIYVGGQLKGMSFSKASSANNIISIEWSSQFALRYWRMAQEYAKLPFNEISMKERQEKAGAYQDKYQNLIKEIGTYFDEKNGFPVAPYAVYPDGTVAANQDTGEGFNTPNAYASVASVYYAFALTRSDPLVLGMMSPDRAMNTPGGIDFTANKTPLEIQNSGAGIKFHLDPAQLARLQNAPGFVPVIINVQPMKDLRLFLGVVDK